MAIVSADDINLARHWAAQLDVWVRQHGLSGYDPFDVKAHPLFRAVQPYWMLRRAASIALDVFPGVSRRLLGIKPALNPKAFALVALARLRLYQMTGDPAHLAGARECLDWLHEAARTDGPGISWGYPFDVSARGIYRPAGIPVGVVTAIAGQAFARVWEITGEAADLEACRLIAEFFVHGLNRINGGDGTFCYSYSSVDEWPVHNSNLHAAAHLYRTYAMTKDAQWLEHATPALEYSLNRQRRDGSWPYGEYDPAAGYEKSLLETVDHHHTGFVLRCLREIEHIAPSDRLRDAMTAGFDFYMRRLFDPQGIPRITTTATWPVNIHACSEAILCLVAYAPIAPAAMRRAVDVLHWTRRRMADRHTGLPYYRKYPFLTNRLLCPRWGVAWMLHALAEFLYAQKTPPAE